MSDFKAKMHHIRFPDPAGGAYSAPQPLAVFKGRGLLLRGGREKRGRRRERGGKGKGREG